MTISRLLLVIALVAALVACTQKDRLTVQINASTPERRLNLGEIVSAWPNAPDEYMSTDESMKRAWQDFERTQNYRLAQPSDRNLTPAAAARVKSNAPHMIVPVTNWWGATDYRGAKTTGLLAAIVVDPSRSDPKRYGLVVLAAVESEGPDYKPYWVLREEDMESYLFAPASGDIFVECFHRDGTEQTKHLVWDRKSRQFRLV